MTPYFLIGHFSPHQKLSRVQILIAQGGFFTTLMFETQWQPSLHDFVDYYYRCQRTLLWVQTVHEYRHFSNWKPKNSKQGSNKKCPRRILHYTNVWNAMTGVAARLRRLLPPLQENFRPVILLRFRSKISWNSWQ